MIRNLTKKTVIASHPRQAVSLRERAFGMIGKDFSSFDGMIFASCNAIHSFFMSFPIDVIFADKEKKVLKKVESFPPWRPYAGAGKAYWTIELPPGTLQKAQVQKGDELDF